MTISSDRRPSHPKARRARLPRLRLNEIVDGTRRRLILTGELDMVSSVDLEDAISSLFKKSTSWLVLDLSRLTFMDLYGLRTVLFARELCEWQGCDFGVDPGSGSVQRMFEPTNLLDLLATPMRAAKRCSVGPLQTS